MNILQQPDILSFAGNVNDFVIEDVTKSLTFKLSVDDAVVVNEVYVADGGMVRVPMKDIVDCFLTISIPQADLDYMIQSLAVKKFKAEIEQTEFEFTVVKGGISNVAESSAVFLKTQWLTLQPQEKRIMTHQPEYLSYYAVETCSVKITVYFPDGSANETLLALEMGNLHTIDVSYLKISGKFERAVGCYDVWVENENGQRLTYVQRYILSPSNTDTNVYLFENTLGGIDSVVFTGKFTEKIQTEGTVTTVLEESTDSDIDLNFSCEQNTGFIPSIDYARWLRSFFVSKQRYHVSGALRRIYLRESENGFTINSLNDFTFEFFYSKQTKYDVVTRNRDDLPHLLEFPEVDSIPFLAPRLAEFPIAVVADDLMLPVQYTFENAWRRISVAAITRVASDEAIDKIDLSAYWKKTELVREELYLKFLDKYIRAKFADDSDLWDGHAFKDYLDQALRTTDSPEFVSLLANYLKSKDFVSGLSGYKVGKDTEVETLKVRRFLEVVEYLVNQISLIGDEVILTEGGEIDSVEILENGYYKCELREESVRAGELKVGDICMTDFKLENGFRKIHFEITKVGNDNTIEVYPEDPAYPPRPLMTFRRRGNFTDETRQNSIRLSSHDQIIEMLSGVNSYDVTWKNRDILIGKIKDLIPEIKGLPERARQKATFFGQNMVLLGNIFQVSADGVTQERVPCYKGLWTIEKAPFFYYDQVTDGYCRYTCVHEGEEGTMEEPRFDSDVWEVADGDTALNMKMYNNTGSWEFWDRLDILFDASVEVFAGNKPINNLVNEWEWWLETGDAEFDAAWKADHGSRTDTQHVDGSTFPTNIQASSPVLLWCRARIYNNGKTNTSEGYLNLQ
ncbi:hypothetical protein [Butyricimonas virosa]